MSTEEPGFEITVLPDGERVVGKGGENLLVSLSRAGLGYRIGCRRGGCGVCKLHLLLGEVAYERPVAESVLSDDERVEGICLSCRAVPLTDVVIELQEGDKLRRLFPRGFGSAAGRPSTASRPSPTASPTASSSTASPGSPPRAARRTTIGDEVQH